MGNRLYIDENGEPRFRVHREFLFGLAHPLSRNSDPLGSILECPPDVAVLLKSHQPRFQEVERHRQELGRRLLADTIRHVNPAVDRVVATLADLAAQGVAPQPPRDHVQLVIDGDYE